MTYTMNKVAAAYSAAKAEVHHRVFDGPDMPSYAMLAGELDYGKDAKREQRELEETLRKYETTRGKPVLMGKWGPPHHDAALEKLRNNLRLQAEFLTWMKGVV